MGGSRSLPVDIRLLAATNSDLPAAIRAGTFREDLYYRLAVLEVALPPLRERPEDIPSLCDHFLRRIADDQGLPEPPRLDRSALRALVAHDWPGNVRQLDNVLTRAALLAPGEAIRGEDLLLPSADRPGAADRGAALASRADFHRAESQEIAALLATHRWNVSETARQLGMSRTTLYARMRRYGLTSASDRRRDSSADRRE